MLAIIIAWIVILFVLLSFGDMFVSIYNRVCGQREQYNFVDTFLLGICLILIPLQLSSLWLPSGLYILLSSIFISVIYWLFNRKKLLSHCKALKNSIDSFSITAKISLLLSITFVLIYCLWSSCIFDAAFYHHQNIKWFEEYAIVPGLGNLESRFGFNSNYLLLSSVFTFRSLFNEPIYALQSALFILVMVWIWKEVVKSNYSIKQIILLFLFCVFFFINRRDLADSSTDILPNICIFYLFVRFTLYPQVLKNQKLLMIVLPVCLITFKLSTFPLCLLSLYILVYLIRNRSYKTLSFTFISSVFIIGLWFVRNAIISGYLIYPMHEIDIFSFDWKMPESAALTDRFGIHNYARHIFSGLFNTPQYTEALFIYNKLWLASNYITILTLAAFLLSFIGMIYIYIKKKAEPSCYFLYAVALVFVLYWVIFAPDFRFANGMIYGALFLSWVAFLQYKNKEHIHFLKYKNSPLILFALVLLLITSHRAYHAIGDLNRESQPKEYYTLSQCLYKPVSAKTLGKMKGIPVDTFTPYEIAPGKTIYLSTDPLGRCYDKLPATAPYGIKDIPKVQDIKTVELRGKDFEDGFRVKTEK